MRERETEIWRQGHRDRERGGWFRKEERRAEEISMRFPITNFRLSWIKDLKSVCVVKLMILSKE